MCQLDRLKWLELPGVFLVEHRGQQCRGKGCGCSSCCVHPVSTGKLLQLRWGLQLLPLLFLLLWRLMLLASPLVLLPIWLLVLLFLLPLLLILPVELP